MANDRRSDRALETAAFIERLGDVALQRARAAAERDGERAAETARRGARGAARTAKEGARRVAEFGQERARENPQATPIQPMAGGQEVLFGVESSAPALAQPFGGMAGGMDEADQQRQQRRQQHPRQQRQQGHCPELTDAEKEQRDEQRRLLYGPFADL